VVRDQRSPTPSRGTLSDDRTSAGSIDTMLVHEPMITGAPSPSGPPYATSTVNGPAPGCADSTNARSAAPLPSKSPTRRSEGGAVGTSDRDLVGAVTIEIGARRDSRRGHVRAGGVPAHVVGAALPAPGQLVSPSQT